ncbi:MAG: hypothetical protein GQ574_06695 [Crocinitomix sp.]|nr:hypothetical protein [Crocinitomix sp.]
MEDSKRIRKKTIPSTFQNIEKWETNRRTFLRGALIAGALTQITAFTSCSKQLREGNEILTAEQSTILFDVLNIFFPDDGNGPSIEEINAFGYIMWVLQDTLNRKTSENDYIIEGIDWANETAEEIYFTPFVELDQKQKEALVGKFTELNWGKNWSSVLITLICEAVLLDPLYGGNTNEVGWEWLNHTPGFPRPTEELRYERIMEKQMKIVI